MSEKTERRTIGITESVIGFAKISIGLCALAIGAYLTYSAWVGHEINVARLKEFQTSLSRANGGNYLEEKLTKVEQNARLDYLAEAQGEVSKSKQDEAQPAYDVNSLSNQEANELLEALFARQDINDAALAPKKKKS